MSMLKVKLEGTTNNPPYKYADITSYLLACLMTCRTSTAGKAFYWSLSVKKNILKVEGTTQKMK